MLTFFLKLPPNHYDHSINEVFVVRFLAKYFCSLSQYRESIDIYSRDFSVLRTYFKSTLKPISHYNYIALSKYELDPPEP